MASAIGYYVAWRMSGGEIEPVAWRRRRKQALDTLNWNGAKRNRLPQQPGHGGRGRRPGYEHGETVSDDVYTLSDTSPEGLYFDDRTRA